MWGPQVAALRGSCRVIAPDLRGFGQSGDTDGQAVTMESYAGDLRALLDTLDVEQAIVCGLSMGGYIALAFVEDHADRVKGLVLSNTKAGADTEAGRQGRLDTSTEIERSGSTDGVVASMAPKMLGPDGDPDTATFVRSMMARQRAHAITSALRGMAARPDRTSLLARIEVPTLIITGSADVVLPPSESEAIQSGIPNGTLINISNAGHLANLDRADAYNGALQTFVGRL
jgi:pimeloyl-ACP methyl ester carboxylesterase